MAFAHEAFQRTVQAQLRQGDGGGEGPARGQPSSDRSGDLGAGYGLRLGTRRGIVIVIENGAHAQTHHVIVEMVRFVVVVHMLRSGQVREVDDFRVVQPQALPSAYPAAAALRYGGSPGNAAAPSARPGPDLVLHVDDFDRSRRAVVLVELVLFPQFVEHD